MQRLFLTQYSGWCRYPRSYDLYDPSPDDENGLFDDDFFDDEEDDLYEEMRDEDEGVRAPYTRGYRAPVTPWQEDEDEETGGQMGAMIDPDLLDLAPTLQVHPDVFLSKRVLIAGKPGSGKTNPVRRLLEESGGRLGLPFLLIDTDGEYHTLLSLLPGRLIVGASNRLGVDTRYYR
ncbi:MAG TPA: DUF87 domain-containing protein, partial [Ktedonobacteraceae bacterium]|nr:DUF87 domain-containing protein [Ktedonobacteraceae bacterium]